jgi:hypothetical protein
MAVITCSVTARVSAGSFASPSAAANLICGPKTIRTACGRGSMAPRGKARSVPVIPAGITGTPEWSAILATPVFPRCSRPSGDRVPSGKIPTSRPDRTASTAAVTELRAAPRSSVATGMTPAPVRNQRSTGLSMYLVLVRNMTRRCGTTSGSSSESRNETWLEAMIAPPSRGMCSTPMTLGRNSSRSAGPSNTNLRNSQKTAEPFSTVRRSAIRSPFTRRAQAYTPGHAS